MPPDRKYTEIDGANDILREIPFMPSSIETIDVAFNKYIDEELNLSAGTNKGFEKVPVLWISAERAFQIKRDKGLRDSTGVLKLPIITIERKGMSKDPQMKGVAFSHIPEINDEKGGRVVIARRIKQDKTSNFLNADSARKKGSLSSATVGSGQLNFPFKNPGKVVYETISMPMPTYVVVDYDVVIRTEYQQQINDLITPFITKVGQINNFFIRNEGHKYEGFIQNNFSQTSNVSQMGEDERMYETTISIKILGYLIGEGPNRERPKVTVRENAVEVKIPREQVIVGDIPDFDATRAIDLFYRE
tara:strand:+ start:861 stop:1772 length:912 start_codon:yes stop_codon:yes gene_type:complete